MEELLIPTDYDIISAFKDEIVGNEREDMEVIFKRQNQNIIGYLIVSRGQKYDCLYGNSPLPIGTESKPYLKSQGVFGEGMYFIEYNYKYALDYAKSQRKDIVGAVINPKNVLDFTDGSASTIIRQQQEHFNNYVLERIQQIDKKLSGMKSGRTQTFQKLTQEKWRLSNKQFAFADVLKMLDILHKEEGKPKYDAVRGIRYETNSLFGIPEYQTTILMLRNQKVVTEYFNPLNEQERDGIIRKYFQKKNI